MSKLFLLITSLILIYRIIQTENGLVLKGSLLKALAGPLAKGQYAQAAGEGALSIGEVSSVSGKVEATRLGWQCF